jgi:hypothetical protein
MDFLSVVVVHWLVVMAEESVNQLVLRLTVMGLRIVWVLQGVVEVVVAVMVLWNLIMSL